MNTQLAATREKPEQPKYIAVEGPIGAGKTTLAQRLAETFQYPLMKEAAAENPFLEQFYRSKRNQALPTQLFFLLQRAKQVSELGHTLFRPTLVSDFLMEKDRIFAEVNLTSEEFSLYEQIYQQLDINPPAPDLVIYLQAPVNILGARIKRRGNAAEQFITPDYLENLSHAYTRFFHFYDSAPLLIVNSAAIDLAHDDLHYESLLKQISKMEGLRQYFNPQPSLL
ncbi:MAG: deoxynucleoside kinase [Pseudomonadales bacterium]|nr:deoxynucleoside kinase [Pseudomonadales bacterium]